MLMRVIHRFASNSTALSAVSGISKWRMDAKGGPLARIPPEIFDRHMALWGTTGCGKSNVLELLIKRFAGPALEGKMSLNVIEASVLPDRIAYYVDTVLNKANSKRFIWIDLQAGENGSYDHIPPMDLFDIPKAYQGQMSTGKMVGMYTKICRTLFDMPLTGHMENVLKAVVQLMLCTGKPSVSLLVDILYNLESYLDDDEHEVPVRLRAFFESRVLGDRASYKRQFGDVAVRLEALTLDPIASRLFCSEDPKLNLIDAINHGALVVVALRAGEESDDVATTIGRLFLNLCKQVSQSRRTSHGVRCLTLVDEVHNMFVKKDSEDIRGIHKESRKDEFGLCSALQQPGDMCPDLFETYMNCSGMQMVGKMKSKPAARKIADDMGLDPDEIMALETGQFYLKVSDLHEKPILVNIPLGSLGKWKDNKHKKEMKKQALASGAKMRRIMATRYGSKRPKLKRVA